MYETLEQLDKEINRLQSILDRGPQESKVWAPNLCKYKLYHLKGMRWKFTYPRIYKFRCFLADVLEKISFWLRYGKL